MEFLSALYIPDHGTLHCFLMKAEILVLALPLKPIMYQTHLHQSKPLMIGIH